MGGRDVDPDGFVHLESFVIEDGVPRWRWAVGDIIVNRQLAMHRGRPARDLYVRADPAPAARADVPGHQIAQAGALGQGHHRH